MLYSKPASPNLRALYRPEFDVWMGRARRESDADKVDRRVEWEEFATRGEWESLKGFQSLLPSPPLPMHNHAWFLGRKWDVRLDTKACCQAPSIHD